MSAHQAALAAPGARRDPFECAPLARLRERVAAWSRRRQDAAATAGLDPHVLEDIAGGAERCGDDQALLRRVRLVASGLTVGAHLA